MFQLVKSSLESKKRPERKKESDRQNLEDKVGKCDPSKAVEELLKSLEAAATPDAFEPYRTLLDAARAQFERDKTELERDYGILLETLYKEDTEVKCSQEEMKEDFEKLRECCQDIRNMKKKFEEKKDQFLELLKAQNAAARAQCQAEWYTSNAGTESSESIAEKISSLKLEISAILSSTDAHKAVDDLIEYIKRRIGRNEEEEKQKEEDKLMESREQPVEKEIKHKEKKSMSRIFKASIRRNKSESRRKEKKDTTKKSKKGKDKS